MQRKNDKTIQIKNTVGKVIRELRIKNTGLSANQFANEYDIGNGNISRIENGLVECKYVTLWKIAEALGLKVSDLSKLIEDELGEDFVLMDE